MRQSETLHTYRYDRHRPITLRVAKWNCNYCHAYEIEIPKLGPLHVAIRQALSTLRVKRDKLAFVFAPGKSGVVDGEWGVVIIS